MSVIVTVIAIVVVLAIVTDAFIGRRAPDRRASRGQEEPAAAEELRKVSRGIEHGHSGGYGYLH